ncbi:MAG: hypothetical protein ABFD07_16520 [Methanobacterium sp.]
MIWTTPACNHAKTSSKCDKNRKRCPGVTCKDFELRMGDDINRS